MVSYILKIDTLLLKIHIQGEGYRQHTNNR